MKGQATVHISTVFIHFHISNEIQTTGFKAEHVFVNKISNYLKTEVGKKKSRYRENDSFHPSDIKRILQTERICFSPPNILILTAGGLISVTAARNPQRLMKWCKLVLRLIF